MLRILGCPGSTKWDSIVNAYNAACLAASLERLDLADSFSRFLKTTLPNEPDGFHACAMLHLAESRPELAIVEYVTTIAIRLSRPEDRNLRFDYLERASLLRQVGDLDSAFADWRRGLALGSAEARAKLDSFCMGRE